jgi:HAD superfamily hydrolase (TIGR01509 family)
MMPSLTVFDHWVASCEVGLRKPDPQIYLLALRQAGVGARAAIYVDDRPELIEAGRGAGLTAIRFESGPQLEQELRAVGVNV